MRIQHNIMAMNAYRNYNTNTSALSKNLEKLSSGYKINRAGDDAAGLAISEKMRAQITGLNAAQKNVKDGVSLVKTAEGAMQEIQDMLNRMDYLATQSANGTYDNEVDRANLQKEVEALKTEINRIADSANFNGIKLLNGDLAKADAVEASTTTTKNNYSGMDRIITSVLGKDDVASIAAGKKTIFDTVVEATKPVKASFAIDLTTLEFTCVGTGSFGAVSFTLQIGGVNLTVEATGIKASMSAASIAKIIASAVAKKASTAGVNGFERVSTKSGATGVAINGVDWSVSAANGVLTFTQKLNPTTQDEARANFDVNITFGGENGIGVVPPALKDTDKQDISMSASLNAGTYVKTAGVAVAGANKANTVFNIKAEDIQDGTQIAIGSKVIVLKVGDTKMDATEMQKINSAKKTGQVVVSVTINATDDLNTALSKISNKAGSTVNLTIATKNGGTTTVQFKLGVSDGGNGNVTGLTIQRVSYATKADHAFDSLEKLANNFAMRVTTTTKTEAQAAKDGLTLQIGDTSDKFNQMNVVIGDMHTTGMGIQDVDISNAKSAAEAVQTIKDAINYVSSIRGDLGAVQNRLEHTANNLSVMAENIQDAESTIRDTDIAEEMMAYTKNNILIQSAQAMLAQANAVPQGVLQLLG